MERVLKYELPAPGHRKEHLIQGFEMVMTAASQFGRLQVWVLIDDEDPIVHKVELISWPTGVSLPPLKDDYWSYVDTVLDGGGALAWHIFARFSIQEEDFSIQEEED